MESFENVKDSCEIPFWGPFWTLRGFILVIHPKHKGYDSHDRSRTCTSLSFRRLWHLVPWVATNAGRCCNCCFSLARTPPKLNSGALHVTYFSPKAAKSAIFYFGHFLSKKKIIKNAKIFGAKLRKEKNDLLGRGPRYSPPGSVRTSMARWGGLDPLRSKS